MINKSRKHSTLFITSCIGIFLLGVLFYLFIWKIPSSEAKLQSYKDVAQSIYDQLQDDCVLIEIPDGIQYSINESSITVCSNDRRESCKITAKMENGKLVFIQESESVIEIILSSIMFGFLAIVFAICILLFIGMCSSYTIKENNTQSDEDILDKPEKSAE